MSKNKKVDALAMTLEGSGVTEIRSVKHTLTQDEKREEGEAIAKSLKDIDTAEGELANVKAQFKLRLGRLRATVSEKKEAINTGYRFVDHSCEWMLDYENEQQYLVDTETGDVLEQRKMDIGFKQQKIFDDKQKSEKAADIGSDASTGSDTPADSQATEDKPKRRRRSRK